MGTVIACDKVCMGVVPTSHRSWVKSPSSLVDETPREGIYSHWALFYGGSVCRQIQVAQRKPFPAFVDSQISSVQNNPSAWVAYFDLLCRELGLFGQCCEGVSDSSFAGKPKGPLSKDTCGVWAWCCRCLWHHLETPAASDMHVSGLACPKSLPLLLG